MRYACGWLGLGLAAAWTAAPVFPAGGAEPAVQVKVVKYQGLAQAIRQLRGKVVVVDFWSDTCIPCKREFPNLVRMHATYPSGSFAAVSVSLDDPNEPGAADKVLRFLRAQKATFANFILDEKPEFWQEKFKFDGPPCVYVFNAQGGIARQFKDDVRYTEVEELVKGLIAKK